MGQCDYKSPGSGYLLKNVLPYVMSVNSHDASLHVENVTMFEVKR